MTVAKSFTSKFLSLSDMGKYYRPEKTLEVLRDNYKSIIYVSALKTSVKPTQDVSYHNNVLHYTLGILILTNLFLRFWKFSHSLTSP